MLTHAQEEAEKAAHNYIGTEHLLLGLLAEPTSLGGGILVGLGVETDVVRKTIDQVLGVEEATIRAEIDRRLKVGSQ